MNPTASFTSGERVKVRTPDGRRWWMLVTKVKVEATSTEAIQAGVQGLTETTLTGILEGPR
jgi:hypothetical protein